MRLDVFLKLSRLEPRRSLAQKMCEGGAVLVNGARAKSSHTVRVDDEIKIRGHRRTITVKVAELPAKPPPKSSAAKMYVVLSQETTDAEMDVEAAAGGDAGGALD